MKCINNYHLFSIEKLPLYSNSSKTEGKISLTRRRWVNELQVEYNLNNSEFVDKGDKNYFLYSITQQRSEN